MNERWLEEFAWHPLDELYFEEDEMIYFKDQEHDDIEAYILSETFQTEELDHEYDECDY